MLSSSIESGVVQAQQRADMQAMTDLITAGQKVKINPNAIEGRKASGPSPQKTRHSGAFFVGGDASVNRHRRRWC
jgi:hypothetical protein